MNYYIFVVNQGRVKGKKVSALTIYNELMKAKIWGLGGDTPNLKRLKQNDRVVFYQAGRDGQKFLGTASLASGAYKPRQLHSWIRDLERYPYQVDLQKVEVWEEPKPVRDLVKKLGFVSNKSSWGVYFQGGTIKVSEDDYEEIISGRSVSEVLFPKGSFKFAAFKVLKSKNQPMSVGDITSEAIRSKHLRSTGKTPERTMGAILYSESKKPESPFVQLGKNRFGLREWGLETIKMEVIKAEKEKEVEEKEIGKLSISGPPLKNIRGMTYGPLNENGVIYLFALLAGELGIVDEEIRPSFPDAKARRETEKGWVPVWIEFEYRSSHFKTHKHDHNECDVVVCWEHDWTECPIEVIELKWIVEGQVAR